MGWVAGVGGMLPRMVFADSVDSVDSVSPVARGIGLGVGLLKAPSRVGEMPGMGSSLMGDMRRDPSGGALALFEDPRKRARYCCCSILNCRPRSLSTSISSGEALPSGALSALSLPAFPPSCSSPCWLSSSLMSVSVASSSRSWASCWVRGEGCDVWVWYDLGSLAANLCSGGRAVGGGVLVVVLAVAVSLLELGEGSGAFVIIAFPSLPREAQRVS